jgi:hypothetical protein
MIRTFVVGLLASSIGLVGAAQAGSQPVCKPVLAVKDVQFSTMQAPTMERKWTAVVTVDASRCATTAGYFEVGFLREKENGVELEFREQFIWSVPSVKIGLDFWADEAAESHWIDSVQACPCAR